MTMPFAQPFKAPKTIKTPGGQDIPVGWTLLTTYSKYGEAQEIWVPVLNPHDITPDNMALVRANMMVRHSDGSIDQADSMTLEDAKVTPAEFEKGILHASMFTAVANYGIMPADIANHAGLKAAFLKSTNDLSLGKLPDQDWGHKMNIIKRQPSYTGDKDLDKFNEETAMGIMAATSSDELNKMLSQRSQQLGSLLIRKDTATARTYINTLPENQRTPLLDTLNIVQHPELERSQNIDLTKGMQESVNAQLQESQRIWQMRALEASRAGQTEMPAPPSVYAPPIQEGTGATSEKVGWAQISRQQITEHAVAQQRLGDEERRRRWRDLVEQARNQSVQKRTVTTF